MTRKEFETALCAKIEDIKAFYKTYNPEAFNEDNVYLTISISADHLSCNNAYWDAERADFKKPVAFWKGVEGNGEITHDTYNPNNPYMSRLD